MNFKITVGLLTRLKYKGDFQRLKYFQSVFSALNEALEDVGLPLHHEPANLHTAWSVKMESSGIHYLRRLAAHIALYDCLPDPCKIDPTTDPCYLEYLDTLGLAAVEYRFDHLFFHSDCSGFYLPVDFENVLYPELKLNIPGDMIGSSYRLRDECFRISERLGLPLNHQLTSEELRNKLEKMNDSVSWQKYAIEAYGCLVLYQASLFSIELGAAIVFH